MILIILSAGWKNCFYCELNKLNVSWASASEAIPMVMISANSTVLR
jgi:hypothetical protein